MKIIAIVNEKGGTAKTTTTVSLSAALGELGKKVLLVDLDGQAASSRWLGVEGDNRFAEALWQGKSFEPVRDVIPNVSLAPGSGKLDSVAHDLRPTQGGQLRKILNQMQGFDYTLIDCPPSLGNRLIGNALLAATDAIVPVETSILALDGLRILLTTIQDVRDGFGHNIELAGVVACRYDARTKLSRMILEELQRALPGKVFKTVIRENVRLRECPASGQSILTYAPDSHATEDYRALAREVIGLPVARSEPIDLPPQLQRNLTNDEAHAVREMHSQVDQMLRHFSPKANGLGAAAERPIPAGQGRAPVEMPADDEELPETEVEASVAAGPSIDDTPLADLRRLPEDDVAEEVEENEETSAQALPRWLGIPSGEPAADNNAASDDEEEPAETLDGEVDPAPAAEDEPDQVDPAVWQTAGEPADADAEPVADAAPPTEAIPPGPEPEPPGAPLEAPQAQPEAAFYLDPTAAGVPETPSPEPVAGAADELDLTADSPAPFDEPACQNQQTPPTEGSADWPEDSSTEPEDASDGTDTPPAEQRAVQDFPALRALLAEMGATDDSQTEGESRHSRHPERPVGAK